MTAESDASSSVSDERRPGRDSNEGEDGRQLLLNEARTTTDKQLAQINKLDDEAVRTVRMAFVLSGLLVGGAKFFPLAKLGLLGTLGTVSVIGSLLTSLLAYGTSNLFVGLGPDALSGDSGSQPDAHETYAEVMDRYERGLVRNRRISRSNGIILAVSRLLLAGAIVFFASSLMLHLVARPLLALHSSELLSVVGIDV